MAAVSVTDNNTRRQDMEGAVSGTTNIGAGAGPQTFAEAVYQAVQAWGRKIGATSALRGFFVGITTIDMTAAANAVALLKGLLVNKAVITSEGVRLRLGSSTSNYSEYLVADDGTRGDVDYPPTQDWLISPIDPGVAAWRDFITTLPTLTAMTEVGISAAVTVLSVNENIIFDAIDFSEGLFLVGGDSTDPDGVLQDFVDHDEGTITAGRIGHISTRDGIVYWFGKLVIGRTAGGTATATVYTDSNQTLVCPGGRVAAGWNEIEADLGNATTDVNWNSYSVKGRGRDNIKRWFDSSADEVDGTNDEVDITGHGFLTGDTVLYSVEGGTAVSGLTDATEYFVRAVTVDAVALYAMSGGRDNAYTDTSRIVLTAAGTGQQHSLRRTPDTRPDLTVTGTTGVGFNPVNCSLESIRNFSMNSKTAMVGGGVVGFFNVDMAGGTVADGTSSGATTSEGEAGFVTSDPSDISGWTFNASPNGGHAVEGDTLGTFPYTGNSHVGYGGSSNQAEEEFNASTDVAATSITITGHPYADGDAAYYDDQGGAAVVGLTDQTRYYVNSIDANTVSLHVTRADAVADANRIGLTAGSSETHALRSADAAFLNSSGGLITLTVSGGDTPSVRNTAGSSTVVNNDTIVTFINMRDNTEVWVFQTGTKGEGNELAHIENATAGSPDARTFAWSAPATTDVFYILHHFDETGDDFQTIRKEGFVVPSGNVSIDIGQVLDRNSVD